MKFPSRHMMFAVGLGWLGMTASAQQILPFPTGPYFANCRGPETAQNLGGDDDFYNAWYFELDRGVVVPDRTPAPDFWILLFDGDSNPTATADGANDMLGTSTARTAFEYRLFGGARAAEREERYANAGNPDAFVGQQIDIDSDSGDDTLRTDDPDDNDNNSGEDLRDQGWSRIGVDIDASPGEIVGNNWVYKFTVDARRRIRNAGGTGDNLGNDRNRYKILATRDWAGTDVRGIQVMTYEYSIAGRPGNSVTEANVGFLVPPTPDNVIDLQTLDFDDQVPAVGNVTSRLATTLRLFGDAETYETGEQNVGGSWYWSGVIQVPMPATVVAGRNQRGPVDTTGQVGSVWVYSIDPVTADNAFSIRIWSSVAAGLEWLPMRLVSVFEEYGDGGIRHYGAGLPRATPGVTDEVRLFAENASPSAAGVLGVLVLGVLRVDQPLPFPGLRRYVSTLAPVPESTLFLTFSPQGAWQMPQDIPPGISGFAAYSQVFQLFDPAGSLSPVHSNGVTIRLP